MLVCHLVMSMAERLSDKWIFDQEVWHRSSLSKGHYQPTCQQARRGFKYSTSLPLIFYHVLTKNFVDFPSSIWEPLFNVTTTGLDQTSSFFSHAKEYKWVCWANYSLLQEQSYPLLSQEWPRHNLSLLYQYKLSWLVMRINKNINQGMFYDLTFNSWN